MAPSLKHHDYVGQASRRYRRSKPHTGDNGNCRAPSRLQVRFFATTLQLMPNVDAFQTGSFCWVELATSDQQGAKRFYSELFTWNANDIPIGSDEFYTMFELRGRDVAAAYTMRPDQKERGVPPHWMLYVAVENADSAAEKAAGLGGKILAPPFDVFDVGRMAVIQDPTGAVFAIWQAKRHHGVGVVSEEGSLCWADLNTTSPKEAAAFYTQLFGWETEVSKHDSSGYLHLLQQGNYIGGIPPIREGQGPSHWLIYYQVSGIDKVVGRANSNGGKTYQPPFTVPDTGKIAVLADPQGAVFALFEPLQKG
jgi:uncharacterized protein